MRFEIYKADDGYRWRLYARNGKMLACGGDVHERSSLCADALARVVGGLHSDLQHTGVEVFEVHPTVTSYLGTLGSPAIPAWTPGEGLPTVKLRKQRAR